jgi:hypothetical protein
MPFASGSLARIAYAPEVTWGTAPVSGYKYIRFVSDTLTQETTVEQSKEIRPDRNNTDAIRTDITGAGDINFEFSAKTFDDFIEGAACNPWAANVILFGGNVLKSFAIERAAVDVNVFDTFLGMRVNQWDLTVAPGTISTGKFTFIGKRQEADVTTGAGTPTAPTTTLVMNAIDNIEEIRVGDLLVDSTHIFTEISFSVNNNMRAQPAIGVLGAADVALGTCVVTGTLTAYLDGVELLNDYLNFAESALSFKAFDAVGNSYTFEFPRIKFTAGDDAVKGQNTDTLMTMNWSNLVDNLGVAFKVTRVVIP